MAGSVFIMTTNTLQENVIRHEEQPARLDWIQLAPEIYKAMVRLDTVTGRGVEAKLLNLIKIRSSQLNHCAFCLDMHSKDALAAGESADRIIALNAWAESRHFYTVEEIAAIELTDAITVLTDGFVPDAVYANAARLFGDVELVNLIAAITTINAWNRFGVATRMAPGHYTPAGQGG